MTVESESVAASVLRRSTNAKQEIDSKINAYEREPVPEDKLYGYLYFFGLFTSTHTAGTEFAIGPLFVANGSTALDVVVGLLVGNFLGVLTWRFIVAPLAVTKRLTANYAIERVVGRRLMIVYDLACTILLAGIAGVMCNITATAFAHIFNVPEPQLQDLLPPNAAFAGIAIICGLVTTVIAAVGFSFVTVFGTLMTPILVSGIIYFFTKSLQMLGIGQDGCGLWCVLNEKVYTGVVMPGQSKFGMAHCIFFAWFCNLLNHWGQNDLSFLRFGRTANVGWMSIGGMYFGHYFAWITAGCMYAVQLMENGNTSVAPGPIADLVGGGFGLAVIIFAGWSTANPCIYASGLALQHIFPKMKAWLSTIIVGLVASVAACFPALTNGITAVLTYCGIILAPLGIVLSTDYYIFPRLGLQSEMSYTLREGDDKCVKTNFPAVWTWFTVEVISLPLAIFTPVSPYFTPIFLVPYTFAAYLGLTKYWVKKGWINYDEVSKSKRSTALVEEGSDEADPSEGANEVPMEPTDVA